MDVTHDSTGTIKLHTSTIDEQMVRVTSELFDIERIVMRQDDDQVLVNALLEFGIITVEPGTFKHVMDKTEYNKYNVTKAFAFLKEAGGKKQQFSVHYVMAFDTEGHTLMTDQMEVANYIDQTG